jgi:hypothetical protein
LKWGTEIHCGDAEALRKPLKRRGREKRRKRIAEISEIATNRRTTCFGKRQEGRQSPMLREYVYTSIRLLDPEWQEHILDPEWQEHRR